MWAERLNAAGVPAAPVLDYRSAFEHPQAAARAMKVTADHPDAGPIPLVGSPVKLSAASPLVRRPPPRLGEHTDEVLSSLGLGDEEIRRLREAGAV